VWYDAAGGTSHEERIGVLIRAGALLRPLGAAEAAGPGIVFFDAVSPALIDFLRRVSRSGLVRVLAIAESAAVLHDSRGPWALLRAGAADVFAWDHWRDPVHEVVTRLERWAEVDALVASPLVRRNLLGESPSWIAALRDIIEVARFTDAGMLVTGESGTGKELVARLIHSLDRRRERRELVVLDCTTVVAELAGSEFFGHERGAFTGASGPREGAFALADRGTLFLDEIGELRPHLQAQLLRVIQEGTYKRVGGNVWHRTSFRLVCATHRDLPDEVARGAFRADLYYRIASVTCRLPPLRDRPDDIVPLFLHFIAHARPDEGPPELDDAVRMHLVRRAYPGNVRDLEQLAARVACRHVGSGPITAGDLPEDEWPADEEMEEEWRDGAFDTAIRRALACGVGLKDIGRLASESAIRIAVGDEDGNLQRAAHKLGVTDRALQLRKARGRGNGARVP
jgi:transcriptional regulator with GAF, ATPase, and Fis domain